MAFCPWNRTPLSYRRKQFPPCQSCRFLEWGPGWHHQQCDCGRAHGPPTPSAFLRAPVLSAGRALSVSKASRLPLFPEKRRESFRALAPFGMLVQTCSWISLQGPMDSRFHWDLCSETSYGLRVSGSIFNLKGSIFLHINTLEMTQKQIVQKVQFSFITPAHRSPQSFQVFLHIFAFICANINILFCRCILFMHKNSIV